MDDEVGVQKTPEGRTAGFKGISSESDDSGCSNAGKELV